MKEPRAPRSAWIVLGVLAGVAAALALYLEIERPVPESRAGGGAVLGRGAAPAQRASGARNGAQRDPAQSPPSSSPAAAPLGAGSDDASAAGARAPAATAE
jgi:hypothetical protein